MEDIPSPTLRRRRAQLLKQMPALETLLRGSLIERYKRCGKPWAATMIKSGVATFILAGSEESKAA